jgi:hypothetical protein
VLNSRLFCGTSGKHIFYARFILERQRT